MLALSRSEKILTTLMKPIYVLYEKYLWSQIKDGKRPQHIAIIPDGNRRWAKKQGLEYFIGHRAGYERAQEVLQWIWDLDIRAATIYVLSTENCLKRSEEEKENIFNLLSEAFVKLKTDRRIFDAKVKVRVIGNYDLIPDKVKKLARELEEATSNHSERILNIAVCYGGRHEILEAIKSIAIDYKKGKLEVEEINEQLVSNYLLTKDSPDPDLIIRTSGEERISNFLLWQSAYSELYFTDVYWPEFRKIDLWRAIRSFQRRKRNFGS
ncbi:MAG: polyprenyl diphosphate synthase [Fervidicoccaceae archaeon]